MPPVVSPVPTRSWEIDALRGLMLVLMTVTHLPSRLTEPLGQPFGFVSAAEGFVLLSAYVAGMVYDRVGRRKGIAAMERALFKRALKIYFCQAAALVFLFTVIAYIGLKEMEPAVTGLMSYYLAYPRTALLNGLLLVYQPPLLDILPLYIIFMLASPLILAYALRHGWTAILVVSGVLWGLAQFGLSQYLYDGFLMLMPMPVPYRATGAFVTWSWQFLWMIGLWMGASRNADNVRPLAFPRWAVGAALVVGLVCFVWRHAVGQTPFPDHNALNAALFDKWHLAPLRMLDLASLVVITITFGPALARRMPRPRWLETLGRASLPVFCAHLVLVLLTLGFFGPSHMRVWWEDALLVGACFACLTAVAHISARMDRKSAAELLAASGPPLRPNA